MGGCSAGGVLANRSRPAASLPSHAHTPLPPQLPIPLTVKVRLGENASKINVDEVVGLLGEAGAAAVTVHGRCGPLPGPGGRRSVGLRVDTWPRRGWHPGVRLMRQPPASQPGPAQPCLGGPTCQPPPRTCVAGPWSSGTRSRQTGAWCSRWRQRTGVCARAGCLQAAGARTCAWRLRSLPACSPGASSAHSLPDASLIFRRRSVPVIGNGDVLTHYEAARRMASHGCLAVMVGRWAAAGAGGAAGACPPQPWRGTRARRTRPASPLPGTLLAAVRWQKPSLLHRALPFHPLQGRAHQALAV